MRNLLSGMSRSVIITILLTAFTVTTPTAAQDRKPLLMEGKQSLFQRVLTRPGTELLEQPGGKPLSKLSPLSIFYAYDRLTNEAGTEFVEVGTNSSGRISGWVRKDDNIDWKQALVLTGLCFSAMKTPCWIWSKPTTCRRSCLMSARQSPPPACHQRLISSRLSRKNSLISGNNSICCPSCRPAKLPCRQAFG